MTELAAPSAWTQRSRWSMMLAAAVVVWAAASPARAQEEPLRAPTWSAGVTEIVAQRCVTCHHAGGTAPMSLETYEATRPWARAIAREVESGSMPPWHASPEHGRFANDRRLAEGERERLLEWVEAGAPEGARSARDEGVATARARDGWSIGTPDLVLRLPEAVEVPASGDVPYHDYVIDPGFEEDVWIKAAEARPGNREVVHHIIVNYVIDDPLLRRRLALAGEDGRVQGSLGGYVPGDEPMVYPDGLARRVPAGSKIFFQMHYTPSGEATTDRSELGLVFATEEPEREVKTGIASSPFIHIPAHAESVSLEADYTFRQPSRLLSLRPHMHLRGKSFEYRALYPDGSDEILLWVPSYDFDWQTRYVLEEPKSLPVGTRLVVTGTWDNSSQNPRNPDPSRTVSWGQQTTDEMMIGFFEYSVESVAREEEPSDGR